MADDRLPCCRSVSIVATSSDKVMSRPPAISLRPFQNASSRLTLVLWPAMTIERLTTGDFIGGLLFRSGDHQDRCRLFPAGRRRACASVWADRGQGDWRGRAARPAPVWFACGPFED